ncbi:MAG: GNAT family N-acetyltransferase [Anaerolineae bacterium]
MIIRPATSGDASAIGQMWLKLVQYHNALSEDLPHAAPNGAEMYARRIASRLHDSHTRVLVAEVGEALVGFVFGVVVDMVPEMFEEETAGFLADIYVEPDYRGHGIGRALVDALNAWFQKRGVQYVEWYVANQNVDGHAFWKSVGGREVITRMRINLNNGEQHDD